MTPPEWACGQCGHMHDADRACLSVLLGHGRTCDCNARLADRSAGMTTGDRDQQQAAKCLTGDIDYYATRDRIAAALAAARAEGYHLGRADGFAAGQQALVDRLRAIGEQQ